MDRATFNEELRLKRKPRKKGSTLYEKQMNYIRKLTIKNIKRGDSCSLCASKERLQFHHKNSADYKDVITVCQKCHTDMHRRRAPIREERREQVINDPHIESAFMAYVLAGV